MELSHAEWLGDIIIGAGLEAGHDVQLRTLAADALGRMRWESETPALVRLAEGLGTAGPLRLRCIEALLKIGGTAAWAAISQLAEDDTQAPAIRQRAIEALRPAL